MSVFSENLKARTRAMGLSQVELARRLDLDPRRVGHYMTGLREPDLAMLARLVRALDTSSDALIGTATVASAPDGSNKLRSQITAICMAMDRQQLQTLLVLGRAILEQQRTAISGKPRTRRIVSTTQPPLKKR